MNWKKHKLPALLMLMIVVYSCASMGTPEVYQKISQAVCNKQ